MLTSNRTFLLGLLLALTLALGMLLACSVSSGDDDDNDTADDDAADDDAGDDDTADDDATDDDATDDDVTDDDTTDDDTSDDDTGDDDTADDDTATCPPISQAEAAKFYWPSEPPIMGGQTMILGVSVSGHNIVAPAGIIAMHGLKVDQLQWTIADYEDVPPGDYDLAVPEGGTIMDGDPNQYISMIFNATLQGTYDGWWISVSGCITIDEIGWIGDTFSGVAENVVFRELLSSTTGEIDWTPGAELGFMGTWTVDGTITAGK